ncbi:24373_t:CDS:2, partial [Racocetra persica]
ALDDINRLYYDVTGTFASKRSYIKDFALITSFVEAPSPINDEDFVPNCAIYETTL